jgi:uncharacterized membrane protein
MAFASIGLVFSAVSTYDFVAHLDRQIHSITCAYVPGLGAVDVSGTSGCHAVLMSPYSSVLRSSTWGGIPIALPSLAVFAFLLFRALDVWVRKVEGDRSETRFLVAATALPLLVSIGYFWISTQIIGTVCKLCVGLYAASLGVFLFALLAHLKGGGEANAAPVEGSGRRYGMYLVEGVVFVVVPVLLYLALKPAYSVELGRCGQLLYPQDKYGVRVKLNNPPRGVPAIEVLDPLCPACKGFAERLVASDLNSRLKLELAMFPLDKECNWMVSESLHPGACAVSEAVLCAGDQVRPVLEWIFAHQEELRELGLAGPDQVYQRLKQAFPRMSGCLDKPAVKAQLNRSLRWAVSNSLPVLTPQLYVRDQKVCDEDTDLGLEYVLTQILDAE